MQKVSLAILGIIILTVSCGLVYLAVQQDMRIGANDPQIQMAHDVADALEAGAPLQTITQSTYPVDMGRSLSLFIIVYDESGKAVAGSGFLHNALPALPPGVLDYARAHGENRLTWQPEKDIRNAIVIVHYKSGFVLAGRSLREVEKRIDALTIEVAAAWIFGLVAIAAWAMLAKILDGVWKR